MSRQHLAWIPLVALTILHCNTPDLPKAADRPVAEPVGTLTTILSTRLEAGAGLELSGGSTAAGTWQEIAAGARLAAGSKVRTLAGVQAELSFEGGTVLRLNEHSECQLQSSRGMTLQRGEVLATVEASPHDPVLINTPAAQLRITGTKLNVKVDGEHTLVDVSRGQVVVTGGGTPVEVGAGERALVKSGGSPQVSLSEDLALITGWARELGTLPGDVQSLVPGFGSLSARVPGQGKSLALKLARHKVRVTVQDNIARTEIEQDYENPSNQTLEGTYRFPLPPGASISRLALYVGDRLEEGEIVERRRARQIFRKIVEDTIRPRDPALLEWVGGRTFQMKIFPITGRSSRRVILAYTETLDGSFGRYRYVYPMASGQGQATTVGDFSLEVELASGQGIGQVQTPLYPAEQERGNASVRLRYAAKDFRPARSFVATFSPATGSPELQLALHEPASIGSRPAPVSYRIGQQQASSAADQGGFFMAVLRPELPRAGRAQPKDYLFLLDTSYSARPAGWELQRAALEGFLSEMDLRSRFAVLTCDAQCRPVLDGWREPTSAARQQALTALKALTPGGSSNLQGAFLQAAALARSGGSQVQVVYFGDGRPSAGELREPQLARLVVDALRPTGATLSALQIGEDVGELFLAEATRKLGGAVYRLGSGDDVVGRVFEIVAAQYRPTLTDIELSFEGLDVHHVYPEALGSISAGSEAVLVGRYSRQGQGAIVLRGRLDGQTFERRYPIGLAAGLQERANTFIPPLWAKHHLDKLSVADYAGNRQEIVRVSQAYTVLSRATAFLVLENERMYREFNVKRRPKQPGWQGSQLAVRGSAGHSPPAAAEEAAPAHERMDAEATPGGESLGGSAAHDPAEAGDTRDWEMGSGASADVPTRGEAAAAAAAQDAESVPAAAGPFPASSRAAAGASRNKMAALPKMAKPGADQDELTRPFSAPGHVERKMTMPGDRVDSRPLGFPRSRPHPRPQVVTRATIKPLIGQEPATGGSGQLDRLSQEVAQHPLQRAKRQALHRALVRRGDYELALTNARSWLVLDGDHPAPLLALADLQTALGEREEAARGYASTVDIQPWNAALHRQLAALYHHKGQPELSCAHLWSLVSLAPADLGRHRELAGCLSGLPGGRALAAQIVAELAAQRQRKDATAIARLMLALQRGELKAPFSAEAPRGGALRVSARWDPQLDLDLALIGPGGERITALRPGKGVRLELDSTDGQRPELLRARWLATGTYRLEISRPDKGSAPISGVVEITALGKSRLVPFVLSTPTQALAEVVVAKQQLHPPRWRPR